MESLRLESQGGERIGGGPSVTQVSYEGGSPHQAGPGFFVFVCFPVSFRVGKGMTCCDELLSSEKVRTLPPGSGMWLRPSPPLKKITGLTGLGMKQKRAFGHSLTHLNVWEVCHRYVHTRARVSRPLLCLPPQALSYT